MPAVKKSSKAPDPSIPLFYAWNVKRSGTGLRVAGICLHLGIRHNAHKMTFDSIELYGSDIIAKQLDGSFAILRTSKP